MLDKDFLFGAASSAYQIEGAWDEDGKGPSIWDMMSIEGKIQNKHTGHIACNHYHEWKNDVRLMEILGLQAYRFSISWARIFPTAKTKKPNQKGLQFYINLVRELKKANIEPFVTLYHWDLPLWLDKKDGWANPESIDHFVKYAKTMFEALPEVKYWITFNEPAVFIPNYWGHTSIPDAIKNVLLAHGKTVESFKESHDGKIGISLNLMPVVPADPTKPKDNYAADNIFKRHNQVWLDPLYKGHFPHDIDRLYDLEEGTLKFTKDEAKTVSTPTDFLGVNYYTGLLIEYDAKNYPTYARQVSDKQAIKDEMGTEAHPEGVFFLLERLKDVYGNNDIYITENGCACPDIFAHDKHIHDHERIRYIRKHLEYLALCKKEGINVKGYFYWSLMDNFEWGFGYNKRFGLLYIFYPTQSRVCKDSYFWYKKIIVDPEYRVEQLG